MNRGVDVAELSKRLDPLLALSRSLLLLLLLLNSAASSAQSVTVAVAANFAGTLERIAERFTELTGEQVFTVVAATGVLHAQIEQGAPFHVFLAADQRHPADLVEGGLALNGSRFTYALGRLAFWLPGAKGTVEISHFQASRSNRLALANPRLAPYGAAAEALLQSLPTHTSALDNVVYGQDVAATFSLIHSGNAPAGLVALPQLLARNIPHQEYQVIDAGRHPPIAQDAVLTRRGADNPTAQRFMTFLLGRESRALIKAAGYELPQAGPVRDEPTAPDPAQAGDDDEH